MDTIEKISMLCKSKGTSVSRMLKELDLSNGLISNCRARGTIPNSNSIQKIADYLEVSTDYLLGKEQKNKSLSEKDKLLNSIIDTLSTKSLDELKSAKIILDEITK